jgi:uncharacterized protein YcbK (DUF882 family)
MKARVLAAVAAVASLSSVLVVPTGDARAQPAPIEPTGAAPTAKPPVPLVPPSQPILPPPPGQPSAAPSSTAAPQVAPFLPKKDRDLADKRARAAAGARGPVTKIGQKPSPIINVFHRWTQEFLPIPTLGPLPTAELQNRLLRDHYTNATVDVATVLVPQLVAAARSFRVLRVDIVSGYRHPKYNLILRKKGHEVARDSAHSHGKAVDFRLPGVTTEKLAAWAMGRRIGGVGTYLQSQFVHMDVGPVRRWSGE